MRARRMPTLVTYLFIILCVVAGYVALWWVDASPTRVDKQQTIIVGQTRFVPDSDASLRVVAQDLGRGGPIAGAQVTVSLQSSATNSLLYKGQTDETGSVPVRFHVPADASVESELVVETVSSVGRDRVVQPVSIEREYRLLLSTDKPLYQPGQVIHMRALALGTFDLVPPRGATVDFLVQDPKGNKVFRQSVATSDFGIAAADFPLADMVNQGNYKLSVAIGQARSETTVEVHPYVLPKFGVQVSTERPFYLPGQQVEGTVQADYFFGKPVALGQVQIVGSVWDVTRTVIVELQGQTDESGVYKFGFELPAYFAGSGLDSGQAQFALEATVIDQTDHAEQASQVLPIAAQPLLIEAVAESGVLKPSVENIVYVLTSYPDGRPAPARLQISVNSSVTTQLTTNEFGLAEFTFVPQPVKYHSFNIVAQDKMGLVARREVRFEAEWGGDSVLLRADRAAYVVGEIMNLIALTPVESGDVYLDIIKAGQMLSTRSTKVRGGKAEFVVDVSADMYGTLELHAYKALLDGTIVRDTRLVVVDTPNDIAIDIGADKETYLPGETATINLQTSAKKTGAGVQTALGVAMVDESVFALQSQDAGFAKLYFMLEQELLQPRYQVKSFEPPAQIPSDEQELRLAQDAAAKASWAWVRVMSRKLANSHQEKVYAAYLAQRDAFGLIGWASALGLIFILLGALVVAGVARAKGFQAGRLLTPLFVIWPALLFLLLQVQGRLGSPNLPLCLGILACLMVVGFSMFGSKHWLLSRLGKALAVGLVVLVVVPMVGLTMLWRGWGGPFDREKALPPEIMSKLGYYGGPSSPAPAPPGEQVLDDTRPLPDETAGTQAPRLRQYFPETLYWAPEAITDQSGYASLQIPMADSITTWRLTALASSQDGRLGFATSGVRVFQDFFVDIDLPVALTQGDQVSIPVGVFNYLPRSQQVRLMVKPEPWFELMDKALVTQTLTIASNDIEVVYFPIRVLDPSAGSGYRFGPQGFQVTAWGEYKSDAIRREVDIVPDGKEIRLTEGNWLQSSREISVTIPAGAVPGTSYVEVKICPGVIAQVVEGLEKILRLPYG